MVAVDIAVFSIDDDGVVLLVVMVLVVGGVLTDVPVEDMFCYKQKQKKKCLKIVFDSKQNTKSSIMAIREHSCDICWDSNFYCCLLCSPDVPTHQPKQQSC